MTEEMENMRYELTLKAREWARTNYTRKNVIKEKENTVKEFVRDPEVLQYIKSMGKPSTNTNTKATVNTGREVQTATIDYNSYMPFKWGVEYKQIDNEAEQLEKFIMNSSLPYLIESEKGMGKTLLVTDIALKHNLPLYTVSCSSGTRPSDLTGRLHVDERGSFYQLGALPTAIELANHFGHAILYMDEINTLENEVQKICNPVFDERCSIYVNGKTYRLNDGCKLSIVATMNPVSYSGVNSLNEDLKSRFVGKVWNHTVRQQLELAVDWTDIQDTIREQVINLCEDMKRMRIKGELSYSLSTRDVKQLTDIIRMFADGKDMENTNVYKEVMKEALSTCVINHKLDTEEERKSMGKLVYDVFGVQFSTPTS